jgi:cytoskeletal protein CcmA (bactofilin family)
MAQNWKKFGGIKQLDALNHLTVNSITADDLALRNPYNGTFAISGELFVYDDAEFRKDVDVKNHARVDQSVFVRDKVVLGPQYERGSEYSTLYPRDNATNYSHFLHGDISGVGINVMEPQAILDICGTHERIVNVYSASESTSNVLARNKDGHHVALEVDASYSKVTFAHSGQTTSIVYEPTMDQLRLPEQVVFGSHPRTGTASLIADENGRNTFRFADDVSYCTPLQVRTRDTATHATSLFSNGDHIGWHMGGGALLDDRPMGFLGWSDVSGRFYPSQVQVAGDPPQQLAARTGFNTYLPSQHAVDINGPLQLKHQELRESLLTDGVALSSVSFAESDPLFGIAVGNASNENQTAYHTLYRTVDGGRHWLTTDVSFAVGASNQYVAPSELTLGVTVYDVSHAVAVAKAHEDLHVLSTNNRGASWTYTYIDTTGQPPFFLSTLGSALQPFVVEASGTASPPVVLLETDISVNAIVTYVSGQSVARFEIEREADPVHSGQFTAIGSRDGNVYVTDTDGRLAHYTFTDASGMLFQNVVHTNAQGAAYTHVAVSTDTLLACGDNVLTAQDGVEGTFVDLSFAAAPMFRHVIVHDRLHALAVGDQGALYYTRTGIAEPNSWQAVPDALINGMGNVELLRQSNLRHVHARDALQGHFSFTCDLSGTTRMVDAYLPDLWYPDDTPAVLQVEGHLASTRETLRLFDTQVQQLHVATQASNLYLDLCGTTHMNRSIHVDSHHQDGYHDRLHVTDAENAAGLYFDRLHADRPMLKANDTTRTTANDVVLADLSNTVLVDGNLRIGGNLYLDGSTNVIESFEIVFRDGKSADLDGTQQPRMHVNYLNLDPTGTVDDLKGSGFYMDNDRPTYGAPDSFISRSGFLKVSNENVDKLSLRSIGDANVVGLDFPLLHTHTPQKNTLLVLHQNAVPTAFSDVSDNYYVRSSHSDNTTIDVSAAMQNIVDLSVNHNVDVYGSQRIHQTLDVYNNALFHADVDMSGGDMVFHNREQSDSETGVNYRSSHMEFVSSVRPADTGRIAFFDATQTVPELQYGGDFDAPDTSNSCLLIRTTADPATTGTDNMVLHAAGHLVLDTGTYSAAPSRESRTGKGNIVMLPYSDVSDGGMLGAVLIGKDATTHDSQNILDVSGNAYFGNNVRVKGNFDLTGTSTITGTTTYDADLNVNENLSVGGESTLSGNVQCKSDVTITGDLVVTSEVSMMSNVHVGTHLGVGRAPSSDYTVEIEGGSKGLRILEIGKGTVGKYDDETNRIDGTITLEHSEGYGYNSIVFKNANHSNNSFGAITYVDDISNSPVDLAYTIANGNDNNNGCLFLNSQNNASDSYGDHIVIRPIKHLILDTGSSSSEHVSGDANSNPPGDVIILPNGGKTGIGRSDPQTTLDLSGDVSFNGLLYVRDQVGMGMQPDPAFSLSVVGDVSFSKSLFVSSDVSLLSSVHIADQVGVGMQPDPAFSLSVVGDVSFSESLFVSSDVSMLSTVRVGTHLGVGREPSNDYAVEIEGGSKGLRIREIGKGSEGASNGGTITLEHSEGYGYNSIVFKNANHEYGFGAITYVDDVSNSPVGVDLAYSILDQSKNNNGCLFLNSQANSYDAWGDHIVIRPMRHLILDTGASSSEHSSNQYLNGDPVLPGDVIILPNGGNMGVGTMTPQHTLDVSGNLHVNNQVGIGMAPDSAYDLSVEGDVSFGGELHVQDDATFDNNVSITGNLAVTQNLTIYGNTTTLESEVTTIKDPLIVLGDYSGNEVPDIWDRGVFFLHDVNAVGFMGYDKSRDVFRFKKSALHSGDEISFNQINDTITNTGNHVEGTLLAHAFQTDNCLTNVQLRLYEPTSSTSSTWSGITSRVNTQLYNVASGAYSHLFTYGGGTTMMKLTKDGMSVTADALGTAINNEIVMASFQNLVGPSNNYYLEFLNKRHTAGNPWTYASTRIQQKIDVTNQAYIEFNPPGSSYGMAFGTTTTTDGVGTATNRLTIQQDGKVGIGRIPTQKLDVEGFTRITGNLGVGRAPSTEYEVEIEGSSKGLRILEIGKGSEGTSDGGTITLEHDSTYGYNSIVFKSANQASDFGAITYVDDISNSPVDLAYANTFGDSDSSKNGCLFLNCQTNANDNPNWGDHIVIRPTRHLILDTGNSSSQHTIGGDVVILPNGGNMGVGTMTPSEALDVSGNAKITGTLSCNGNATLGNSTSNSHKLDGSVAITSNVDISGNVNVDGGVRSLEHLRLGVYDGDTSDNNMLEIYGSNYSVDANAQKHIVHRAKYHVFRNWEDSKEVMRIDASKNDVGIGTSSPTQKLDVSGGNLRVFEKSETSHIFLGKDSSVGAADESGMIKYYQGDGTGSGKMIFGHFEDASGGNDLGICVKHGGSVGINNNTPSVELDVSGNAKITGDVSITSGTASSNATTGALVVTGGIGIVGDANVDGGVRGNTNLYLGIYGSTENNDRNMLEIYGSNTGDENANKIIVHRAQNHIFKNWSNGNNDVMKIDASNNYIGINTNNPSEPLDVVGNAKITGTLSCDGNSTLGNATDDSHTLNGSVEITSTTESTTTTTGALKVSGGVGIVGNMNVGGGVRGNTNLYLGIYGSNEGHDRNMLEIYGSNTGDENANKIIVHRADTHSFKSWNDGPDAMNINGNGNVAITGNATIGDAITNSHTLKGSVDITSTTQSDSKANGALVVSGGVGINSNVNIGGEARIAGDVGIGTSTPTQRLDVVGGNIRVFEDLSDSHIYLGEETGETSYKSGMIKYYQGNGTDTSGTMHIGHYVYNQNVTNPGLYVKGNGYTGINTDNPTYTLDVTGNARISGGIDADYFNATSDYRAKEKIQTISGELYTVDHLRPVSYVLKHSQQPHIGFIAHELQEHFPTAVSGEKDGEKMQSVNYSELVPVLVKEVQDLKRANEEKNAVISQLQQDMAELKAMIQQKMH